jgi:hypothetical protein
MNTTYYVCTGLAAVSVDPPVTQFCHAAFRLNRVAGLGEAWQQYDALAGWTPCPDPVDAHMLVEVNASTPTCGSAR